MNEEAMKQVLEALKNNRRTHYGCEDSWYSCPKHEDGCANEHAGSECNCGADEANAEIDAAIKVLQEAQQEPEMVAAFRSSHAYTVGFQDGKTQAQYEPDDLMAAYMSGLYDGKRQ